MTKDMPSSETGSSPSDGPDPSHAPGAVATLKQAMRRARLDNAERAGVLADQRTARLARLEILQDELRPLVAQIPPEVDMFDVAIMPGANPRLFIDMIGFVEMGRDPKLYRLLQDTRHGRIAMAESADVDTMVDAVTDYVARRLLERDRALAANTARGDGIHRVNPGTTRPPPDAVRTGHRSAAPVETNAGVQTLHEAPTAQGAARWAAIAFAFVIDLLGSVAFFTILAAIGWYVWNRLHTPV